MKLTLLLALAPVVLQGAEASLSWAPAPASQITVTGAAPGTNVEFFDGVTPLGAATADTSGNALFNARSLTPGLHTISAVQRGSGAAVAPGLQISVPAAPAARFAAPASYALGIQPAVMAAHGLIATAGQGTVSVLLPGSASAAVFPGIAQPTAIIVADFNGDGANDIAVANATGSVAIYLNNGSGSYSNTATYQSGGHPSGMAFADFNNDGVPDLAIANETEHTVAILPGRADGSFGGPIVVGTNIAPHGIVAADLNGDGFADLALTGFASNTLSVLLGDGTGNFRAASTITVDNGPSQILAGDFNEDGATDLAVLSEVSHTVDVLLNNGSGAFTGGASVSNATSFTAGHVTGSTHLDLLVQIGSELQVFAGAGDGTFQAAAAIAASGAAQLLAAGDFNGDGLTDIAAADLSGVLSVFPAVAASAHVETGTASGNITADGVIKPQVLTSQMERAHALVSSSVTLASSNTASYLSQSITLTATLTPSTATGTVTFYAGQSIVGIRSVSAGQASMTTDLLPTGTYPLTARYSGDANDNPGLSPAVSQTVAALPQNGLAANGSAAAGATPHGVVTADFNNDGIADIAVADNAGSAVMVFLGNGNGGFSAGTSIGANSQPFGIAAVDVNGDGNTDLVVTNANAAEVTVLLGNGTGSFSIFGTYSTGNNPQGIAAADFNGDGIADLVVSNVTDGTLTVLLGHGDGSFPTTSTITVGNSPTSVAVADFNVDGLADIVATNSGSATVTILLGNGNGTFQTGVTYSAGTQPYWVAATDLNGDGYPDLAVANNLSSGADVSILLNKSSAPGTFPTRTAFTAGISPHYIGTGDFNGDGIPDLLVINKGTTTSNGTYTILTGSGTGTFTSGGNLAVGNAPWAAAIADFNRDGRTDAAAASSGNNDVYFLLGVGLYPDMTVSSSHTGSFTEGDAADTYTLTVTNSGSVSTTAPVMVADTLPAGLTATAISGSGWTCTLSSLSCSRSDVLAAGTSYPAITLTVSVASNAPLSVTNSVAVSGGGEVNTSNDTGTDVTTIIQTTTLSLVSSQNPSTSGQQVSFTATISNSAGTGTIVFYDGGTPLLTVTVASGAATFSTGLLTAGSHSITARYSGDEQYGASTSPAVLQVVDSQLQNGFQAGVNYALGVTSPSGVAIADFNGDGNPDFAVSNSSSTSKVTVFLGNGDGTFKTGVGYTVGSNTAPYAVVSADFNGDGIPDLAVANNNTNTVSVLIGNGDGTFKTPPVSSSAGTHPQHLAVADFNRDGIPDLAVADYTTGIVSVLLGNGDGSFQAPKTNTVGGNPRALVLRDFNGDGLTDIAVANYGTNTVNILLGNGNGTFQTGNTYSVGTSPQWIVAADFNGDGFVDLAVANNASNNVTVLLGNGTGGFTVAATPSAGTNPTGLVVNDFNGDGIPDLAVSDSGAGVSLLIGVGNGTFQSPLSYTAGTNPAALATADVNKDGLPDLVVANGGGGNATVLLGGLYYSSLTIASSHTGNFSQGQTGAQYTVTVSNVGQYSSAGTVTATDTLPAGLTATAIAGAGWNCTLTGLSCTRSDSLAPGASYPSITVTVNVSNTANASVTNTVTVSGGHQANGSNDTGTDPTTVMQQTTLTLAPSVPNWVYAEAVSLVATVSQSAATGTVTFYQGSSLVGTATVSGGTASLSAPSLTPGTYQFSATYSGDSLYVTSTGNLTVIVGKATAGVTLSGLSVAWTGNPQPVTVTTNPTGLNVGVTYNGLSGVPSNAGSYTVVATVNDPNYTGSATGTLVITPVQATVTLSIPTPTYNGSPQPVTATTNPTGLNVSITYGGSSTAPAAAGTYPVTATVITPNYAGTASGTLIIAAAPLSITLSGLSTTYNGAAQPVTVTTNPASVSVNVTYNGKATVPTAAGSYAVSVSSANTNYTGSTSGTLVIGKAAVTFTLSSLVLTYNGNAQSATVTSSPAGVAFAATYNGSGTAPTSAGSYALAVTSTDANYTGSASGTFTIQQATPAVSWAQPQPIPFGIAIGPAQLNASSPVNGTFTYTPASGTVLQPGTQKLSAVFTPSDSLDYSTVTATTTITVNPGNANNVSIVTSRVVSRDANNNIVVTVTFSNTGSASAVNLTVTSLNIGTTAGTPLPANLGTLPAQGSVQATFTVPGSAGASGANGVITLAGTFTGGSFSSAGRIALP